MSDSLPELPPEPDLSAAADTWPLTAREAAAALGVHERTVRRAIARGEIAADKRSGAYRIAPAELERYRSRRGGHEAPLVVSGFAPAQLIAYPGGSRRRVSGVPRPLTSLIGRDEEVATIVELVERDDVALVTLTGPGGVGKTRLAIAVAEAARGFSDGVSFVSLATTRDPALVGGTIAQALGIHGLAGRSLIDWLWPALHERRMLLVLDNFEHVVESASIVAELIGSFPGLTVLATSRVRLRVTGEQIHEVPPLALTQLDESGEASDTAMPAAARLFVERARAVRSDFAPGPDDQRIVEAICRRLDGLPLAIELAAAKTSAVTLRGLLDRLEPRLPVLTGGARDLPERQQTMRNAIAWSYGLLTPVEQELFRRLSVFVGGFTLAAAEHVAARPGGPPETLARLSTLVDASLLRLNGDAPAPRYVMLEMMREYGQDQLARMGEARSARDAHASFYLGLDAWLDPNTIGPGVTVDDRLREIEPEEPNIEAALAHLAEIGDAGGVLHLAGQCAIFWHHRAYLPEGRRWLEHGLARTPAAPTLERGVALAGLSLILWTQVDPQAAAPLAQEALAIGRRLGDTHLTALSLHMLGIIATLDLRWGDAKADMEAALPLWKETGEQSSIAMALMILSEVEYGLGALSSSRERAEEALAIFETIGHDSGAAFALVRLGRIAQHRGREAAALAAYQSALRLWVGIGERWGSIKALVGVAEIAARGGQPDAAAILIGVIDARVAETGGGVFPVDRGHYDRASAAARAALGDDRFAALHEEGRTMLLPDVVRHASAVTARGARRTQAAPDALSRREREVLRLLVEGHSNAEIAEALYIGVRTARTHVENILAKLGVPSRTAAATHAIRHNLV